MKSYTTAPPVQQVLPGELEFQHDRHLCGLHDEWGMPFCDACRAEAGPPIRQQTINKWIVELLTIHARCLEELRAADGCLQNDIDAIADAVLALEGRRDG